MSLAECSNVTLRAGNMLNLSPNQGTTHVEICQRVAVTPTRQLAMVVAPSLCIQPTSPEIQSGLILNKCTKKHANARSTQVWQVPAPDTAPAHVIHEDSRLCLAFNGNSLMLESCSFSPQLLWVLGSGGRLCASNPHHGCLSVERS